VNGLPKHVVSTTLDRLEWSNSTLRHGDVFERHSGNELQVRGSGTLIRTLMKHDLVDEYRLLIYPVAVDSGNRRFAEGTTPTAPDLLDAKTTSRGVVVHIYQPAGEPEYGAVALDREGDIVTDS
jgi:dihydrofolate reductase